MRIGAAERVGVPAFGAAGMEKQIVKVPDNQIVIALGRPEVFVAFGVDFERELAIDKQAEKHRSRKALFPAQLPDSLRGRELGQKAGDTRIANPEQRGGARRFQNQVVAASPQIGEPRQDERVGVAKLRGLRPVIGGLRLDGDKVRAAGAAEPVFNEIASRQTPNECINTLIGAPAASDCTQR